MDNEDEQIEEEAQASPVVGVPNKTRRRTIRLTTPLKSTMTRRIHPSMAQRRTTTPGRR
jgi:hypothetical protein